MHDVLIPFLVFICVVALGAAVILVGVARKKILQDRLRGLSGKARTESTTVEKAKPKLLSILSYAGDTVAMGKGGSPALREQLAKAGYHSHNAVTIYLGAKMFLLIGGVFALGVLLFPLGLPLSLTVLLVLAGGILFSFGPNFVVRCQRWKRREEVRNHLPDVLDLLEICVSSGMGLDMAWNAVGEEIRCVSSTLADEMALTNLEMHMGATRADAMRHMAERTDGEDISSLVAVLVQSERFGTSISSALQTFADSMRETRKQRAQEACEKMSVKLLIPMILLIFPSMLIVLIGPAAMTISKLFAGR